MTGLYLQARDSRRDRYSSAHQHADHDGDGGFSAGEGQPISGQFATTLSSPAAAAAAAANLQASLAALQAGQLSLGQVRSSHLHTFSLK